MSCTTPKLQMNIKITILVCLLGHISSQTAGVSVYNFLKPSQGGRRLQAVVKHKTD